MSPLFHGRTAAALALFPPLRRRPSLPDGNRRIYHYHIRKSGGTSLNAAFWNLAGVTRGDWGNSREIWKDGYVFVRHTNTRIEQGRYFHASGHTAHHAIEIPRNTFTITILRDPLKRLLSHYRYLVWLEGSDDALETEPFTEGLVREFQWLGSGFGDFLDRISKSSLQRQLFFFSENYDIEEACANILNCSAVCFTDRLDRDIEVLSSRLDLTLESQRERVTPVEVDVSTKELERARELLRPEFQLIEKVRSEVEDTVTPG